MNLEKSIEKLKSGEPIRIVALGDSLTQGWMVRKSYLHFLAGMLSEKYPDCDITIINRGVPGDTADGGLFRLREDVLTAEPDLVLIQFALNDAFMGVNPERFKNTVAAIVDQIRSGSDAEILLVTSVPVMNQNEDLIAEGFYARLSAVSEEKGVPIALVHRYWKKRLAEGLDFQRLVQYDGVHPTAEGHELMAEAIFEMF